MSGTKKTGPVTIILLVMSVIGCLQYYLVFDRAVAITDPSGNGCNPCFFNRVSLLKFSSILRDIGEEPKKRKSKWDVSAVPAPPVKTATPPGKVGVLGPIIASSIDVTAAKKPKIL